MPGFARSDKRVKESIELFQADGNYCCSVCHKEQFLQSVAIFLVKPLCNNKLQLQQIFTSDPALTMDWIGPSHSALCTLRDFSRNWLSKQN